MNFVADNFLDFGYSLDVFGILLAIVTGVFQQDPEKIERGSFTP